MKTVILVMMPQEQKKDKRQRLKKQMAVFYPLTAYVCHAARLKLQ